MIFIGGGNARGMYDRPLYLLKTISEVPGHEAPFCIHPVQGDAL
jgi:hypothetical protein